MPTDLLRRTIALPTLAVGDTVRGTLAPSRGGAGIPDGALQAAIDWLCLTHDVTGRHGSSIGYPLIHGWLPAFPRPPATSSGRCSTTPTGAATTRFARHARARDGRLGDRGAEPGRRRHGRRLRPSPGSSMVFNTGMVIFGWVDLHETFGDDHWLEAARRAGQFLAASSTTTARGRASRRSLRIRTPTTRASPGRCSGSSRRPGTRSSAPRGPRPRLGALDPAGERLVRVVQLPRGRAPEQPRPRLHAARPPRERRAPRRRALPRGRGAHGPRHARRLPPARAPPGDVRPGLEPRRALGVRHRARADRRRLAPALPGDRGRRPAAGGHRGDRAGRRAPVALELAGSRRRGAGSFPIYGRYAPLQYPNWAAKFLADSLALRERVLGNGR